MIPEHLADRLSQAAAVLSSAERIAFLGHVGPDGDALGSIVGLALSARGAGFEAYASFGEPFVISPRLSFLDMTAVVPAGDLPSDLDVVVACDTANVARLGSAQANASAAKSVIVLDHHASNGGFGDIKIVDPSAAATTQLAFYLIEQLGWSLTPEAAVALYTGLVTDTGRFQYSATTPEVHRVAGALLEAGAQPDEVGQHVYGKEPFALLGLTSRVLGRAELDTELSFVWSVLYGHDLVESGVRLEQADGMIDQLRVAQEADVACLLRSLEPGVTEGSLRSRGSVDVAALAQRFGGGGHHNAAGFTAERPVDDVVAEIRASLR